MIVPLLSNNVLCLFSISPLPAKINFFRGTFLLANGAETAIGNDFSAAFGTAICKLAENDDRICAITAAMSHGTGLYNFSQRFKNRFFDVGIAEQHAVTFAAGLAKGGMLPVFAVYSSFLQRSLDQVIHDAAIAKLPITICVDRAGFVGEDGETHQGLFDAAFLSQIPGVKIYAPSNYSELALMLKKAIYEDGVSIVRYPRGGESETCSKIPTTDKPFSVFGSGNTAIVTYGRIAGNAVTAAIEHGDTAVIKLNSLTELNSSLLNELKKYKNIFFLEEGIKSGGIGEHLGTKIAEAGLNAAYRHIAVDNCFVAAASVDSQLKKFGLDKDSIIKTLKGE